MGPSLSKELIEMKDEHVFEKDELCIYESVFWTQNIFVEKKRYYLLPIKTKYFF